MLMPKETKILVHVILEWQFKNLTRAHPVVWGSDAIAPPIPVLRLAQHFTDVLVVILSQ